MKQKYLLVLTTLLLVISQVSPAIAQSNGIDILSDKAVIDFPLSIEFQLEYQSEAEIEDITLFYAIDKRSCGDQARVHLNPELQEEDQAAWKWDLTKTYNIPPGATLFWHWQLTDVNGEVLTTEEQTTLFIDPNFEWQTYKEDGIQIEWSEGNLQFAKDLHQIITDAVRSLSLNAGLELEDDLKFLVYPTSADLAESGVRLPEWVGGVAYPDFNIIVLAVAPDEYDWAKDVIAHELSHLITHNAIFNCVGGDIPTWLDEGIAKFAESPNEVVSLGLVTNALENDTLPKLLSLSNGFSADTDAAHLSYIQSSAVVHFLIEEYGKENLALLLESVKSGRNFDTLMEEIYGFDTNELDSLFRISMGFDPLPGFDLDASPTEAPESTPIPTIALATPMFQAAETTPTTPATEEIALTPDCTLDPENEICGPSTPAEPSEPSTLSPLVIGIGAFALIIIVVGLVAFLTRKNHRSQATEDSNKEA
ncbi:MAG: hypothetical protein H0S79_25390 [Anaerolineaceae bacterium]|nr:hypothetical protein [Anaerolineaceae bacterium]